MRKQLFNVLLCSLLFVPFTGIKADVVAEEQTTEGTDFWLTYLQADQGGSQFTLGLAISSRHTCKVVISNPYTGYKSDTIHILPNQTDTVRLDNGDGANTSAARARQLASGKLCYAFNSEKVDTCAIHITSDSAISLFASNYQYASFDATNVLPTPSLQNEYIIQTYSPSDNAGTSSSQGSHFAVVATQDNTYIDYVPTVPTTSITAAKNAYAYSQGAGMTPEELALANWKVGDTLHSPMLKKGQVFYVWTGKGVDGAEGDLSGTYIKARGNDTTRVAVFQGCPHTNIPYQIHLRDHIYSQAMPISTWGNTFVLTSSKNRKRDIYRVLALSDETNVYINGNLVYTFDFSTNPKHYWEFEMGEENVKGGNTKKESEMVLRPDPDVVGSSCYLTTSCPCAVHQFMVSQTWDGNKNNNGDPAMLWINPIEQQINQITFTTYDSEKGTTAHYVNVVTANPEGIKLGGNKLTGFQKVEGSDEYWFLQYPLGSATTSYTLKNDSGNFIAHVYGFTANESYAYSAGGYVKSLTQYITINGEIFTPDSKNTLCGEDTVKFACHPDYEYEKIEWYFGDGESELSNKDSVPHYYANSGTYEAYVLIYRNSTNLCKGLNAIDSIPITVTIGRYQFSIDSVEIPCPEDGKEYIGMIYYTNAGGINLHGDNVRLEFDAVAKADGFEDSKLAIKDTYFQISIPDEADPEKTYGIHLVITSDCGGADTTMTFQVNFDNDILIQRYGYLLGLKSSFMEGHQLRDFQWYKHPEGTKVEGQTTSNLNFYDLPEGSVKPGDAFYVSFIIDDETTPQSSCPKAFDVDAKTPDFGTPDQVVITASYAWQGDKIFVNADWEGKSDIECYAQWINVSGDVYQDMQFNIPDGGCTIPVPTENGFYILRVVTDGNKRSFKFIINH